MEKRDREVVLGFRRDLSYINNTKSPDEMFSVACSMMHQTIKVIAEYGEKIDNDEMQDKEKTKTHMLNILRSYDLVDAGMTAEEAVEIVGIDACILKTGDILDEKCEEDTL